MDDTKKSIFTIGDVIDNNNNSNKITTNIYGSTKIKKPPFTAVRLQSSKAKPSSSSGKVTKVNRKILISTFNKKEVKEEKVEQEQKTKLKEPEIDITISTIKGQFDRIPQEPSDVFLIQQETKFKEPKIDTTISTIKGQFNTISHEPSDMFLVSSKVLSPSRDFLQDSSIENFDLDKLSNQLFEDGKEKKDHIYMDSQGIPSERFVKYQENLKTILQKQQHHNSKQIITENIITRTFVPLTHHSVTKTNNIWNYQEKPVGFLLVLIKNQPKDYILVYGQGEKLGILVKPGELETMFHHGRRLLEQETLLELIPSGFDVRLILFEQRLATHLIAVQYPFPSINWIDQGVVLSEFQKSSSKSDSDQISQESIFAIPMPIQPLPFLTLEEQEQNYSFPDPYDQVIEVFGFFDH